MGSAASKQKHVKKRRPEPPLTSAGKETNNKQILVIPGEGLILHRHGVEDDQDATDTGTSYMFLPQQFVPGVTTNDDHSAIRNDDSKEVQVSPFNFNHNANPNPNPNLHLMTTQLFVKPGDQHPDNGNYIYYVGAGITEAKNG